MKSLRISDSLDLPIAGKSGSPGAVTQKYAFLGRTGSGKTYAATKLAELMLEANAQIVALDPVGVWPFLRLGDRPFDLPVLGGLYGDVPLESTGGALVADFIASTGSSAVLDVSQFIDAEQRRFATAFAVRFFQRKKAAPSAVHVFVEECQEFMPQNASGEVAAMLNAFERLVKLGRNFGIGVSQISQRPQEVNKKCLNQTEALFCFQMTGPQERKAIAGWCADKGLSVDLVEALPKLAVGHAHVWSPQWLEVSREVRIAKKRTADGSATPDVGRAGSELRLSPVDLPGLREAMAQTVERAKADDPRELRKRIAELEKELRAKPAAVEAPKEVRVEVPVVDYSTVRAAGDTVLALREIEAEIQRVTILAQRTADAARAAPQSVKTAPPVTMVRGPAGSPVPKPPPKPIAHRDPKPANGSLPKAERQILTTLAQHGPLSLTQAAIIAGYSSKSGGMRNAAGALRALGYAVGGNDRLEITADGEAALGSWDPLPTGEALAEHWYRQLPKAEREILAVVVEAYPKAVALADAAERCGYSVTSGGIRNAAGKLRTLDLVVGGNSAMVANERLVG